jgi:hypothetical protein
VLKSALYGLPSADLSVATLETEIVRVIPEEAATNYRMVSFAKKGTTLSIGFVDPQDYRSREAAEFLAKEDHLLIESFVISERGFESVIKKYRVLGAEAKAVIGEARAQLEEHAAKEGERFEEVRSRLKEDFQIVKLVKPKASRSESSEMYFVCLHFR